MLRKVPAVDIFEVVCATCVHEVYAVRKTRREGNYLTNGSELSRLIWLSQKQIL